MDTERGFITEEMVTFDAEYAQYHANGGIINQADYRSLLVQARQVNTVGRTHLLQAEGIARYSGIELQNGGTLDEIVVLYDVMRSDFNPVPENHHSQMSDQRLFAEALRMLDRPESLTKVIEAHPHISFS